MAIAMDYILRVIVLSLGGIAAIICFKLFLMVFIKEVKSLRLWLKSLDQN